MPTLEWKEEREEAGKILAPFGKTTACDDQWFLQLAIELRCQLSIDELREWFRVQVDVISVFGEDDVEVCVEFMKNAQ
jgi:hypothetical protein